MKLIDIQPLIAGSNLSESELEHIARTTRNYFLQESDWTQITDSPLEESIKAEWATYRQALRDMMDGYSGSIADVEFPSKPGGA